MSQITTENGITVFTPTPDEPKKRRRGLWIGLGLLGAAAIVGPTLAATITLNTNGRTEFGQGEVGALACDSSIDVVPGADYTPSGTLGATGTFTVPNVSLQHVDLTADVCAGKQFKVLAYGNLSGTETLLDTYVFRPNLTDGTTVGSDSTPSSTYNDFASVSGNCPDATDCTIVMNLNGVLHADQVDRFVIETSD